MSGWSVDPESCYTGSPPPRYFQYPTDNESTQNSFGSYNSFVDTTNHTNTNNNNVTDTSADGQDSAYSTISKDH